MRTNIKLIQIFSDSGILRKYAVYLRLKHLYSNGTIFNYSINSLHIKSGLSRNTIRKNIAFYLKNKWCYMRDGHLCFASLTNLRQYYKITLKATISIKSHLSTQQTLCNLRYALLKHKFNQFNYIKKISQDLHNPLGKNALHKHKKAKQFFSKKNINPVSLGETALRVSIKRLALIANLSSASIFNLIKAKVHEGVVFVFKEQWLKVQGYNVILPKNKFYYKGFVYTPTCNKYQFL